MSTHDSRPANQQPASLQQPTPSTDRPTSTYPAGYPADYLDRALPEGWRVDPRPGRYLDPADPADAPRLVQADATPTGVFPTRRSIRPARPAAAAPFEPDAVTTARTRAGAGTHACHAPAAPSTGQDEQASSPAETPLQDMGRPGILRRPSMAWHPSLMQLAIGAALVLAIIGACNVAAINAHRTARAYCHELVVSDWGRAERECRGTGAGTPVPEQVPTAPTAPARADSPADTSSRPEQVPTPAQQAPASPSTKPVWTVHGTGSPYDRTDPLASPLDLPRCTAAPDTPLPCLAHISNDSHHVTVLEEDASLTGLDRQ